MPSRFDLTANEIGPCALVGAFLKWRFKERLVGWAGKVRRSRGRLRDAITWAA